MPFKIGELVKVNMRTLLFECPPISRIMSDEANRLVLLLDPFQVNTDDVGNRSMKKFPSSLQLQHKLNYYHVSYLTKI